MICNNWFWTADIKPQLTEMNKDQLQQSCIINGDEMTLTEMLSKEVGVNGVNPTHVPNSQSLQRQASSQLTVKQINRPASVPSTKKFDDCGVGRL